MLGGRGSCSGQALVDASLRWAWRREELVMRRRLGFLKGRYWSMGVRFEDTLASGRMRVRLRAARLVVVVGLVRGSILPC